MWIASCGSFHWLITDEESHFTSGLMESLIDELPSNHHFTEAYCPWWKGTVERVFRELIRSCRALPSEMKMSPMEWPSIIECLQSIINQSPIRWLWKRSKKTPGVYQTPFEVCTSQLPTDFFSLHYRWNNGNMWIQLRIVSSPSGQNWFSSEITLINLSKSLKMVGKIDYHFNHYTTGGNV